MKLESGDQISGSFTGVGFYQKKDVDHKNYPIGSKKKKLPSGKL